MQSGSRIELTTAPEGAIESEPLFERTTFSLDARSMRRTATARIEVDVAPSPPRIVAFTATPNPAPVSSTVALAWTTEGARTVTLYEGDYEPYAVTLSSWLPASSSFDVVQSRRLHRYRLEAENAFGRSSSVITVGAAGFPPVAVETEPNNRIEEANELGSGSIFSLISHESDFDLYRVSVPAGGNVEVSTSDGLGGCAFQSVLTLYDSRGRALGSKDWGMCPRIDPRIDEFASKLEGGEYFVAIESDFFGDQAAGDGCDAQCRIEIERTISAPGGSVAVAIGGPSGSSKFVALQLTESAQWIRAIARDDANDCPALLGLNLRTGSRMYLGGSSQRADGCARIEQPRDRFAADLSAGDYLLELSSSSTVTRSITLEVAIEDPECGNGIRETLAGEECDDGNLLERTAALSLRRATPIRSAGCAPGSRASR